MKIGIVLPVGRLDKYGYQYFYQDVIENLYSFTNHLYILSVSKYNKMIEEVIKFYPNINFYNHADYQLLSDENDNEVFDIKKLILRTNIGIQQCQEVGLDCCIIIHINQYIPSFSRDGLLKYCEYIMENNLEFGWLYKRYQVADKLFHADTRVPWIINLKVNTQYRFQSDSIVNSNGYGYTLEHGDFRQHNNISIVDVFMDMTVEDLKDKINFVKNYSNLESLKGRSVIDRFDETYHLSLYQKKINKKIISDDLLDETGLKIYSKTKDHFLSRALLKNYKVPNILYKLYRYSQMLLSKLEIQKRINY